MSIFHATSLNALRVNNSVILDLYLRADTDGFVGVASAKADALRTALPNRVIAAWADRIWRLHWAQATLLFSSLLFETLRERERFANANG
jgi:hypothetical protein